MAAIAEGARIRPEEALEGEVGGTLLGLPQNCAQIGRLGEFCSPSAEMREALLELATNEQIRSAAAHLIVPTSAKQFDPRSEAVSQEKPSPHQSAFLQRSVRRSKTG
jgi:hypothetical protein